MGPIFRAVYSQHRNRLCYPVHHLGKPEIAVTIKYIKEKKLSSIIHAFNLKLLNVCKELTRTSNCEENNKLKMKIGNLHVSCLYKAVIRTDMQRLKAHNIFNLNIIDEVQEKTNVCCNIKLTIANMLLEMV